MFHYVTHKYFCDTSLRTKGFGPELNIVSSKLEKYFLNQRFDYTLRPMPLIIDVNISSHFVIERLILCTIFLVSIFYVINIEIEFIHSIINASEYRLLIKKIFVSFFIEQFRTTSLFQFEKCRVNSYDSFRNFCWNGANHPNRENAKSN